MQIELALKLAMQKGTPTHMHEKNQNDTYNPKNKYKFILIKRRYFTETVMGKVKKTQ